MGFEWERLSETGQMRQMPYATTLMEAIEKYSWLVAEQFSNEQDFPLHKISGGELFDSSRPEFKKQLSLISKKPTLYGANHYNVTINGEKRILRYSSCTQKLAVSGQLDLCHECLPIGLFEISKSYRFEEEDELELCNRIRSFHLPELHVLTDSFCSSLKIALSAHLKILKNIGQGCELFCSVTDDFFEENVDFLKAIAKSIKKPFLLAIYNKDVPCEDGVKIDIEYKVFDILGTPVEISTFQVDDGTTDSTFNIKYRSGRGHKKPISTLHIVFNASVERFAYFLLSEAVSKEGVAGFKQLPFWASPIQARVITRDKSLLKNAKELAEKLNLLNFRTDLDDRQIPYRIKREEENLKWIPYIITINRDNKGGKSMRVENKAKGAKGRVMNMSNLLKEMGKEQGRNIIVPRYSPMFLSKKLPK